MLVLPIACCALLPLLVATTAAAAAAMGGLVAGLAVLTVGITVVAVRRHYE